MPGEGRFMHFRGGLCIPTDLYSARRRNLWKEGIDVLLISKKTHMMDVPIAHFSPRLPLLYTNKWPCCCNKGRENVQRSQTPWR